jgi:hypothetical protein
MKTKEDKCIDRYLSVVWRDEYGVPTGEVLAYFAEIPGDREGVLEFYSHEDGFQLLGDFSDAEAADQLIWPKLQQIAVAIPPEERAKWPSKEDRQYVERCPFCGFTYCPRLPKDAEQHAVKHRRFLKKHGKSSK